MRTTVDDEQDSTAAFELAAGCVALVVAAFVAATAFGPTEPTGRVLIMAAAAGLLAALLRDWRVCVAVAVIAALMYVGFLAHHAGQLSGDPAPWRYTPGIGVAALLGRGGRWIRVTQHVDTGAPAVDTRVAARRDGRTHDAHTRPYSIGY